MWSSRRCGSSSQSPGPSSAPGLNALRQGRWWVGLFPRNPAVPETESKCRVSATADLSSFSHIKETSDTIERQLPGFHLSLGHLVDPNELLRKAASKYLCQYLLFLCSLCYVCLSPPTFSILPLPQNPVLQNSLVFYNMPSVWCLLLGIYQPMKEWTNVWLNPLIC